MPEKRIAMVCRNCEAQFMGRPIAKFCSKSCAWMATKGPAYNARIARETVETRAAAQRGTGTRGYVKRDGRHEHRAVAEKTLGRALGFADVVHHIDGDKHNNAPENLTVLTRAQHMREHGIGVPGVTPWWKPWEKRGHAKNV